MAKTKQTHKLLIKFIDRSKQPVIENGIKYIFTKQMEVSEINLGSIKKPNKDIIEFAFEPISDERDQRHGLWFREF